MRYVIGLALAGLFSSQVLAVGRLADVSVIDRETGQRLPAHYHKGEYWVAGRPGAHYSIQISSRDERRLLAVTSVDGVNILTGEDAGVLQRGYVFNAWQRYDVAGWRKTDSEIAAFTFTSIPKSYAARTGRPQNVGVIGVALFAEKQHPRQVYQQAAPPAPPRVANVPESYARESELDEVTVTGSRLRGGSAADSATESIAAPATTSPGAGAAANQSAREESRRDDARREGKAARAPSPSLGTGHGRREYSQVYNVAFDRASSTPDEVIRIRYDSRDNLIALGVIHRPPAGPRSLDPFPSSPAVGYVPDP